MDGGVCRPAALGSALVGGEAGQEDEQERQASEDQHHSADARMCAKGGCQQGYIPGYEFQWNSAVR